MRRNEEIVSDIQAGRNISANLVTLWEQNIKAVDKIVRRYCFLEDVEDLRQQAFLGFYNAVSHYNETEGVPFINYALLGIKRCIVEYAATAGKIVKIPLEIQQMYLKYKNFIREYNTRHGRSPQDGEICHYLGIDNKNLVKIKRAAQMEQIESLNALIPSSDEETEMGEFVAGNEDTERTVCDQIQIDDLKKILWPIVDGLSHEHGKILQKRYREQETFETIAADLGLTVGQVRYIEKKALQEIRLSRHSRTLKAYLDDSERYARAYKGTSLQAFNATWTSATERVALEHMKGIGSDGRPREPGQDQGKHREE